LTVYHGTVGAHADDITQNGIRVARCSPKSDFGKGFYTTRIPEQAAEFANERLRQLAGDYAQYPGTYPDPQCAAVLEFTIVLDALGALDTLAFVQPTPDWLDFVKFCRLPSPAHKGTSKFYDAVYGPVLLVGVDSAIADWEQLSLHTDYAVSLLTLNPNHTLRGTPELQ
jgi:hypothetical protein